MFAQSKPRIFPAKDAAPLQLRHDLINELIEGGGEASVGWVSAEGA
jgi:hypothetical protein